MGDRTSLNDLFISIQSALKENNVFYDKNPKYQDFRAGDVLHSQADINKAKTFLQFNSTHNLTKGIFELIPWYLRDL